MTDDSAFKKQVRARMAATGENYTVARRMVIAGRDPGQPPVALRVYLNPHVDLELTDEAARAYEAADEQGQRDMANRLLADHIELAGIRGGRGRRRFGAPDGPGRCASTRSLTLVHRRIPRAAGACCHCVPFQRSAKICKPASSPAPAGGRRPTPPERPASPGPNADHTA